MLSINETIHHMRLKGSFADEDQINEVILRVCPDACEIAMQCESHTALFRNRDLLDFETFVMFIQQLRELHERSYSDETRQLAQTYGLSEEQRATWQHNLLDLHTAFTRMAAHGVVPPVISTTCAGVVVRECGL